MESTLLLLHNNPLPKFNGLEQQPLYLLSILLIGTLAWAQLGGSSAGLSWAHSCGRGQAVAWQGQDDPR